MEKKRLARLVDKAGAVKDEIDGLSGDLKEARGALIVHAKEAKGTALSVVMEGVSHKATVTFPQSTKVDADKLAAIYKEPGAKKFIVRTVTFSLSTDRSVEEAPNQLRRKLRAAISHKPGGARLSIKKKAG